MKKISTFLILLCCAFAGFSQQQYSISGKVVDAATKQPMSAASVFAENTTIGTATDADGNFKLVLPYGGYDLAVSFTGYQTTTRRITTADADDKNIVIELKQQQKEMADVVVKASYEVADGWEKYGSFFLDAFIGKTANSRQCSIQNKEVLKFYYYKRKNRLKVLATAPIEIVNESLGYKIHYSLDSFVHEYNTESSIYTGSPLFETMTPADESQAKTWEQNRQKAYKGSLLHFMRSLYQRRLKEEGFEIQFLVNQQDKETAIPVKDFYGGFNYSRDDSTQTVEVWPNQSNVALIYKAEEPDAAYREANPDQPAKFQLSVLSFTPRETIVIEQNGYYFEQADITINQYLSWEKVADMLPYDYHPLGAGF